MASNAASLSNEAAHEPEIAGSTLARDTTALDTTPEPASHLGTGIEMSHLEPNAVQSTQVAELDCPPQTQTDMSAPEIEEAYSHSKNDMPDNRHNDSRSKEIVPTSDGEERSTDDPNARTTSPALLITLLVTNGVRHPLRLDQEYLEKHSVQDKNDDPANMSIYKLKELILRDWMEGWGIKPSSPDAIRLISFGKLLDDRSRLSENGFSCNSAPTVVHMAVKPPDLIEDEDAHHKVPGDRDGSERSPLCRCCVM